MKFILKMLSVLAKIAIFVAGLAVLLKLGIQYLEKRGIVKIEWIAQKTPASRGVRWAMSIKDKVILSFQI
jgi:uncharacterized membrane protein (Fun14 family)